MKYLSNVDLTKNQLLQAVIEVLATPPALPNLGQVYYNSADQTMYICTNPTGPVWLNLGDVGIDTLGPDGDKGDVTVGGSGTTLTVDLDAITYAKMQNVVNANSLLGSIGANGVVSELSKAQVLGIINVTEGATPTSTANVDAAGAVMNSDTTTVGMSFVVDEDDMISDLATKVPTQQSVKKFVEDQVAGAIVGGVYYQGGYNATTNVPNLETPVAGTVFKGYMWTVTTLGAFFAENVQVGDVLIAEIDDPASIADWSVVNKNIDDIIPATTVDPGIIRIATIGEANAGSLNTVAISPAALEAWTGGVTGTITTLGTISTGTWQATAIADAYIASAATWNAKQDALTFGIADTNAVKINSATVALGEYAKFTATGLESKSFVEVKTDLSLNNVENTALSTWIGSANITTLGTIGTGVWSGTTILGTKLQTATTTVKGVVEVATQTEVNSGTATGATGASLAVTPATLQVKIDAEIAATKYVTNIGDGAATTFTITNTGGTLNHNLGTSGDFIVQVREVSTGDIVFTDIDLNAATGAVTLNFNVAPVINEYRVVIKS